MEQWLEKTLAEKNVWFAPLREIADHLDALSADGWSPRTERLPYYTDPQE